jgi:4-hydroxybenzoate polyprenyltransferase
MTPRNIFYNSVTVSLPKNTIQFFLGFVLYLLTFGGVDPVSIGVALCAFLLTYSTVYFFNDIVDCEEDIKDDDKREWKLIASGSMSRRTAGIAAFLCMVAGLYLSALVSGWFLLIMMALLLLNFLHSSPYIRLKKKITTTAANMTAIEFLKYSSGWFAFTTDLSSFPFWIIMLFAVVYSGIYLVYKFRFKGNVIKSKKWLFTILGTLAFFSYTFSLVFYDFALSLIILLALSLALAFFSMGRKLRFMNWLYVEFIIMPAVIAAFLLVSIPIAAEANQDIAAKIDHYKDTVYKKLPEDVAEGIKNLSEPPYESLEDVVDAINRSVNLSGLVIDGSGN